MNAEHLVETLIRGALGGRRKKSRGALRYLTGGRGSLLNASTLLAAAGVAWGLYETVTAQGTNAGAATPAPAPPSQGRAAPSTLPPLPVAGTTAGEPREEGGSPASVDGTGVPAQVLRVIRLTIAAARADGTLTPAEHAAILAHARTAGAESLVAGELRQPTPLAAIVAGAPPQQRRDLYTLAFAVTRADEGVSGGERIFLAQLAHQLGLDATTVADLERTAAERIAAHAAEGPPV